MILKYIRHHGKYHIALFCMLTLGVILAYYTRDHKQMEVMILVAMASVYILFGVVHHYLMHDLSSKIVIEYIAMGSLGLAVILFVLKGFML